MQIYPPDIEQGRKALGGGAVGNAAPFTIRSAMGSIVYDTKGKSYIDCTAQAWSLSVGHSNEEVMAAVKEQLSRFSHARSTYENEPKLALAGRLARLMPGKLGKVSFALSGSDAVEGAMKVAMRQRYGRKQGFISLNDGYHGRTLATMALSWPHPGDPFYAWAGPVVRVPQAYCYRCPLNKTFPGCKFACVDAAAEIIEKRNPYPAAIIMEPVQGNGGMVDFPAGYHKKMRELANHFNALLIWDEIQTAFGRVGAWSAAELYGVEPDIMVVGKGLGGGFPIFATVANEDLEPLESGDHSFTFSSFPPSMVAALATIHIIERDGLVERSREVGWHLKERLIQLMKYPIVGDVRGPGLMLGIEIVTDQESKTPAPMLAHRIVEECVKRGVLFGESKYAGLGNVIKIKPPLNIPGHLLVEAVTVLEEVIKWASSDGTAQ